jgi:hypothetical protein
LNQEKALDDYLSLVGDADEDHLEEEYNQKCNQVDKATLKLFRALIEARKVERGYDVVRRLHSERSHDIAVQLANRLGHRRLSDRIVEAKQRRFPPIEEDDEGFDDAASFDSGARSEASGSDFDDEPGVATRRQRMEILAPGVSPEGGSFMPSGQRRSARRRGGGGGGGGGKEVEVEVEASATTRRRRRRGGGGGGEDVEEEAEAAARRKP